MAGKNVRTIPHGDGWANKREGAKRVSNTAATKAEAQAEGRRLAQKSKGEHIIHNKDGSIGKGGGSKQSYGKDVKPPRG